MVTKQGLISIWTKQGSVLAKIHMVTKLVGKIGTAISSSVLAKIHMVTKPKTQKHGVTFRSVLAKIHMVTKPQKYGSTFLNVIEH